MLRLLERQFNFINNSRSIFMLKIKPLMSSVVRASALPALLLVSSFSFAATDAEIADLKARIAALEATPSWNSAQVQKVDPLSIHGFINAGVSNANTDDARGVSGGVGDEMNFQPNQSFGLQVGYQLDDKTDVVAQMLGRAYQDNMNVSMNWAYIGRTLLQDKGPMSDLKLRVGRAPADIYMISEYYDVGYAYPWVTPPREAYDLLGGIPYDGMDLTAQFSLPADWNLQLKGFIGEVNVQPEAGRTKFDLQKIRGVNAIFERDAWRVRLGYGQASVKYEVCCGDVAGFDTLTGGYNSIEAGLAELEANIIANVNPGFTASGYTASPITDSSDNLSGSFSGIGASYDNGTWLVMGEYMMQKWDTYNPDMDLAYITVGKHFGDWMPYLTASQAKVADDKDSQKLLDNIKDMQAAVAAIEADPVVTGTLAQLAPAKDGLATALNNQSLAVQAFMLNPTGQAEINGVTQAGVAVQVAQAGVDQLSALQNGINDLKGGLQGVGDGLTGLNLPQKTYSIGVRYDFAPGATVKVQVDKITGFEDTRGSLENAYVSHFAIQAAF